LWETNPGGQKLGNNFSKKIFKGRVIYNLEVKVLERTFKRKLGKVIGGKFRKVPLFRRQDYGEKTIFRRTW